MSTAELVGAQRQEKEFGRAAKRLKTDEREEGEEELEEGEDSDSGSLHGIGEPSATVDRRACWTCSRFDSAGRVSGWISVLS